MKNLQDIARAQAARPVSSGYSTMARNLNAKLIIDSLGKLLQARTGKKRLNAAVVGYHSLIMGLSEAMIDAGLDIQFYEGHPQDRFHPSRPLSEMPAGRCDIAFVSDDSDAREQALLTALAGAGMPVVRLARLVHAHMLTINGLPDGCFETCLNPNKLGLIAASIALCKADGDIFEVGVNMGGTTNYMAMLQDMTGFTRRIYALDTFTGMPEPTQKDFGGGFVYTSDLFRHNQLDLVKNIYRHSGTGHLITVVPGLCQDTLPGLVRPETRLGFALLDTDQYAGTRAGLDALAPMLDAQGVIIVDDTSVTGVNAAVEEVLAKDAGLVRRPLIMNFDLIMRSER